MSMNSMPPRIGGPMNNDPIDGPYAAQAPKESAIRRYGKKIAGGIACSMFVAFLMHLPYIKAGIVWGCHIVVLLFGKPAGVESLEDKLAHAVAKGRQVAHDHPDAVKSLSPVKAVKEVIAVKKTVDDVKDKAQQSVQTIKNTGEKVADALGHVGEKAKETVGGIGAASPISPRAGRKPGRRPSGRRSKPTPPSSVSRRTRIGP